jgi:phosphinothricin acetyltransferase
MTPIHTRLATAADAAAITAIYNEGIADRVATFETEPRTVAQIAQQLADRDDRFPTVVAERDGQVVAYAGAGPYRSRPAYAGVAEHSVYVARAGRPWTRSAGPMPSAASGRSSPGSSRRTPRASACTSGAASGWSASTTGTASSTASGATA